MTYLAFLVGLILCGLVLQDAFEAMLLPRRVSRRWRLMGVLLSSAWWIWSGIAAFVPSGDRRERFFSIYGPLSMVLLFAFWAAALILAFALMQWAAQHIAGFNTPLSEAGYLSGVTFFTLGYAEVIPHGPWARMIAVIEAGVGFGLIAIVIGYLPVLYQLFSRREAHVIQLDARAGSPPTASVMICRLAEGKGLDKIDDLLRTWETWAADLLESHLSYPVLAYYRSQHQNQSWLAAMAAVMDASALVLVGLEEVNPLQARMTFSMARQVIVELVRSLDLPFERPREIDRLTHAQFGRMLSDFAAVGVVWNGGDHAEETLSALRATYEPQLQALALFLRLDLPGWIVDGDSADHWEKGARGLIARRLIAGLAEGTLTNRPARAGTMAGRLRDKLRN